MMDVTHRMTFSEFATYYPTLFWILIYIAWGAVYGAITVSLVVMTVASKRYLQEVPNATFFVSCMKLLWGSTQLVGVFSFPILVGLIDKDILLHGNYQFWLLGSWALTILIFWLACRKFLPLLKKLDSS